MLHRQNWGFYTHACMACACRRGRIRPLVSPPVSLSHGSRSGGEHARCSHIGGDTFYPAHGLDTEDCPTISGIPAADDILCIRRPVSYVCYLAPHRTVHASARAGPRCDSVRAVLGPDSIGLLLYTFVYAACGPCYYGSYVFTVIVAF